jgi:cholesterol oxidase
MVMAGGVTFDETMEGGFALGATVPEVGAAQGVRAHTKLAMHARVTVDDIDRFVASREHPGSLIGTIDFQPLGMGIDAPTGIFQLFSPGPGEKSRRMVYELAFKADGKHYYLAGEKRVHSDVAGLDIWKDTTILYTLLHEGGDKAGKVVGAGILTLGVPQLLALLKTFKPINGGNLATVTAFGRLFAGELWDVYAPHLRGK